MAQLMTRNAILETELENYEKYMRTVQKQTKKKEAKLNKKVQELKRQMRRDSTLLSSPKR
jgi:hypothetical protein